MAPEADTTLREWRNGLRLEHMCHARSAADCRKKHQWLGVPAIVLTTISGSSGLVSLGDLLTPGLIFIAGLAGIGAGVLVALQTFFNFEHSANSHAQAAAEYGDLRRRVEVLLARPDDRDVDEIEAIRTRWHELASSSPIVPQRLHDELLPNVVKQE